MAMSPLRVTPLLLAVAAACAQPVSPATPAAASPPPPPVAAAPSTGRLAVVDLQRALAECRAGEVAKARLMTQFKASQAELDEEQRHLRNQPHPAPEKLTALQQRYVELQKALAQSETRETAPLLRGLELTLKTLADEKGLDAVIDRASVPFVRAQLDLTDELVRRFDATDGGAR